MGWGGKRKGTGGKRPGSGRKSRAEELGLPKLISEVIGENGKKELVQKIHAQAQAGSFNHQQLIMAYIYGKPTETHNVDQITTLIIECDESIKNLINPSSSESA